MELRVLRYFLAVAQEESISGAADYLHLTQPTLSRQLMDLEEELGKKLFIRGSRKVRLTEDGLLLRKRASEIVELVEKTESEFWGSKEAVAGDVYIGGGESDAMRLIARAARTLQRLHPNVHYHLFSGNAGDVCEKLDKGCLDFGILLEPVNLKRYDYVRLPCTDLWGVLMRKDSRQRPGGAGIHPCGRPAGQAPAPLPPGHGKGQPVGLVRHGLYGSGHCSHL